MKPFLIKTLMYVPSGMPIFIKRKNPIVPEINAKPNQKSDSLWLFKKYGEISYNVNFSGIELISYWDSVIPYDSKINLGGKFWIFSKIANALGGNSIFWYFNNSK